VTKGPSAGRSCWPPTDGRRQAAVVAFSTVALHIERSWRLIADRGDGLRQGLTVRAAFRFCSTSRALLRCLASVSGTSVGLWPRDGSLMSSGAASCGLNLTDRASGPATASARVVHRSGRSVRSRRRADERIRRSGAITTVRRLDVLAQMICAHLLARSACPESARDRQIWRDPPVRS